MYTMCVHSFVPWIYRICHVTGVLHTPTRPPRVPGPHEVDAPSRAGS